MCARWDSQDTSTNNFKQHLNESWACPSMSWEGEQKAHDSVAKWYVSTVIHIWVKLGFLWTAIHSTICRVYNYIYKRPAYWLLLLCIRDCIPSRQIPHSHNHWFVLVSPKELSWDELSVFGININPAKVYWPSSPCKKFSCFFQVPCLHVCTI